MDGKDASLALLRDMLISKSQTALLDRAVLVIVPIYLPGQNLVNIGEHEDNPARGGEHDGDAPQPSRSRQAGRIAQVA
jgi:hypothetical protein